MKLALMLQFCPTDRHTAMRLARLIADNEELPRDDVVFYFCARCDCQHDQATIDHVAKKFPVELFTTSTPWQGWPAGPNGMARDILLFVNGKSEFDGVLMLEPDCVPVHRHWLNILQSEWQEARNAGKVIMGSWRGSGPPCGHLNGNCVIVPNFAEWLSGRGMRVEQMPRDLAWDCYHAPFSREYWAITGRIANHFQSFKATLDDVLTPEVGDDPPVLVHGYKDDSAYNLAREILKLNDDTHHLTASRHVPTD